MTKLPERKLLAIVHRTYIITLKNITFEYEKINDIDDNDTMSIL